MGNLATQIIEELGKIWGIPLELAKVETEHNNGGTEHYVFLRNGQEEKPYGCLVLIENGANNAYLYGYSGKHPKKQSEKQISLAAQTKHGLIERLSSDDPENLQKF